MKTKFIYTIIFSCFFLFSSCSSDDESSETDNPELQAKIQGKWLLEGTTFEGEYQEWPIEVGDTFFDFRNGGVLIVSDDDDSESGTYQVTGNDVTISMNGETATFEVKKLTNSELDLFTMEEIDEEDGLDEVTYHFSKS